MRGPSRGPITAVPVRWFVCMFLPFHTHIACRQETSRSNWRSRSCSTRLYWSTSNKNRPLANRQWVSFQRLLETYPRYIRCWINGAQWVGSNHSFMHPVTGSQPPQLAAKLAQSMPLLDSEQGIKLLGLLLTGSTGQHMASRNGLA